MATVPCLRCCKLVPESAAFCRRCGAALGAGAHHAYTVPSTPLPLAAPPAGSRWPGLVLRSGLFTLVAVVSLFSASSRLGPSRHDLWPDRTHVDATDEPATRSDDDAAFARVRERVAAAQAHVAEARERLESARRRFDAQASPPALQRNPFEHSPEPAPQPGRTVVPPPAPAPPPASAPPPTPQSLRSEPPQILGLSARYGPAGQRIVIEGHGLG